MLGLDFEYKARRVGNPSSNFLKKVLPSADSLQAVMLIHFIVRNTLLYVSYKRNIIVLVSARS